MTDGTVRVAQRSDGDRLIDNEVLLNETGDTVYRQRVASVDSTERELTHATATVTASGDTTIHTPASGKKIRLWYWYAVNDPDESTTPLIKIKLGAEEKFRVFGGSKRQRVTGPTNGALVVNLSETGSVAFTALLEEVT